MIGQEGGQNDRYLQTNEYSHTPAILAPVHGETQVDYLTPFLQHVPDIRSVSAADAQRARDACLKALKDRLLVRTQPFARDTFHVHCLLLPLPPVDLCMAKLSQTRSIDRFGNE